MKKRNRARTWRMEQVYEDQDRPDKPVKARKKVKGSHVIIFFAVGLWVFVILDCFCAIYSGRSFELGSIRFETQAKDEVNFHSYDSWHGGRGWTLNFRNICISKM